jgi:hypothetical protein
VSRVIPYTLVQQEILQQGFHGIPQTRMMAVTIGRMYFSPFFETALVLGDVWMLDLGRHFFQMTGAPSTSINTTLICSSISTPKQDTRAALGKLHIHPLPHLADSSNIF